ncbi:hypothetical protein M3J09_006283 [Ascochyta lentis]
MRWLGITGCLGQAQTEIGTVLLAWPEAAVLLEHRHRGKLAPGCRSSQHVPNTCKIRRQKERTRKRSARSISSPDNVSHGWRCIISPKSGILVSSFGGAD